MNNSHYCKNMVSQEMCEFLTHCLLRRYDLIGPRGDEMVPGAMAVLSHDIILDTYLEKLWVDVESVVREELLPTYSYARLYNNGDILHKHTDRDACEISVTIQLYKSHDYSWPIYIGDKKYNINVGDGIIYKGCEIEHWRETCNGPQNYYSGQAFFHFVRAHGDYKLLVGDPYQRTVSEKMFVKNRIKNI